MSDEKSPMTWDNVRIDISPDEGETWLDIDTLQRAAELRGELEKSRWKYAASRKPQEV